MCLVIMILPLLKFLGLGLKSPRFTRVELHRSTSADKHYRLSTVRDAK